MTKRPATPADVAIARAICDDLRASMRSMTSLRNPRGARLKRDMRAALAHLSTVEASLLAAIMAENPAGNDRVTATIILDARVDAEVRSPFEWVKDNDTGRMVQVRKDGA